MKQIHLWGVKQNNLKNIEVKIPLQSFTVICGPSGSGKSSLAFETLFAEGQRRFIESMSNYAKQFLNAAPKPDIEGINNIPPAIAIEQKNSVKSSRSTVGTTTEVIDYIRLLFEKLAQPHCPVHHIPTEKESVTAATDKVLRLFNDERGYILVEISEEGRVATGKKLLSMLLQDGFLRIYLAPQQSAAAEGKKTKKAKSSQAAYSAHQMGEVIEISDPKQIKKGLPSTKFFIVIDRLAFSEDERGRLADSLSQAYEASFKYNTNIIAKRASVLTTEGKILQLSEERCCSICGYQPPVVSAKLFSFNSPAGACPTCKGFGNILDIDEKKVIPNPKLSIAEGALNPFTMPSAAQDKKALLTYCRKAKIDIDTPWEDLPKAQREAIWNGSKDFFGVKGLFEFLDEIKYKMHVRVFISRFRSPFECPDCKGSRLRSDVSYILFRGYSIVDLSNMTIGDLFDSLKKIDLNKYEQEVAGEIFRQIIARLNFLVRVGVHYLTLSRETRTLSGGEYQRLNLANQLGMGLSQTLYVLDEPTVGLHPRDNERLISILKDLQGLGNTVVIVEHDRDVIKSSDNIIEMGPGSGVYGGEVLFSGQTKNFYGFTQSNTLLFLIEKSVAPAKPQRPVSLAGYKFKIELTGASGHNLKHVDLAIPLNRMVAITGVSGSGKSTLISKTLYPAISRALDIEYMDSQPYAGLEGVEYIKNVVLIDQSPIGKSARSNPITYLKAFDHVRTIMASTSEAKARAYTAGTFSLNVDGGRCPACKGTGYEEIDMMFMDNVILNCDTCDGKKYRSEVLEIQLQGKNIYEILQMTVVEARDFFVSYPSIRKPLAFLKEVGLDYLKIGQPASSLSGGESQRLKIAKELASVSQKSTLYILDEPTTGLHFKEVGLLINVLNKLIDTGGSVVIVEHNLDVIAASDFIIDLGPEAGKKGGQIVAQGAPADLIKEKKSLTGQYLKKYLGQ